MKSKIRIDIGVKSRSGIEGKSWICIKSHAGSKSFVVIILRVRQCYGFSSFCYRSGLGSDFPFFMLIRIRILPLVLHMLEIRKKIKLSFIQSSACQYCFVFLISVIGGIFCNILGSLLKFSGKKYWSSSASHLVEMDARIRSRLTDATGSGSTTLVFIRTTVSYHVWLQY